MKKNYIKVLYLAVVMFFIVSYNRCTIQDIFIGDKVSYPVFEEVTPELLSVWMIVNLKYIPDIGENFKSPKQTLLDGGGDCEDFAILAKAILEKYGYEGFLVGIIYKGLDNKNTGHAIYLFQDKDGTYDYFNNQYLVDTDYKYILDPILINFSTWEEIYFITENRHVIKKITRGDL